MISNIFSQFVQKCVIFSNWFPIFLDLCVIFSNFWNQIFSVSNFNQKNNAIFQIQPKDYWTRNRGQRGQIMLKFNSFWLYFSHAFTIEFIADLDFDLYILLRVHTHSYCPIGTFSGPKKIYQFPVVTELWAPVLLPP